VSRRPAWAPAAVAAYVLLAVVAARLGLPHRPVFDGQAPAGPYRWVDPPPDLAGTNQAPLPGGGTVPFREMESVAKAVQTRDGQAQTTFLAAAFPPASEERAVQVDIRPLDPDELGPSPAGLRFDSNAYAFEASYRPSGDSAGLGEEVIVVLRYARHGTVMLRWAGTEWERLPTEQIRASLSVFAATDRLGTFVVAGPPLTPSRTFPWGTLALLSAGAALLAAGLGLRARRRLARAGRKDGRTRRR
jgi:hypothetical protein